MKRIAVFLVVFFLSSFPAGAEYVPGEIIIKFKPAITHSITGQANAGKMADEGRKNLGRVFRRADLDTPEIKRILKGTGVLQLKLHPGLNVDETLRKLRADPDIEYAEPNYKVKAFATTPDDAYFDQQWGLKAIMADEVWDVERGDTDNTVVVAVIDSGVDMDHPDLVGNLIFPGNDIWYGDSDPNDGYGHGTHVAGIIAAVTNNVIGVAGVSWYAKILPVKVLDDDGLGDDLKVAEGMEWAADNGARILNLSLGSSDYSSPLQTAVDYARGKNCVVIAAAGNDGVSQANYPAACIGAIAVGATDELDNLASFSNYGTWISVVAPGVSIVSTYPNHAHTLYPATSNSAVLQGTSMAAPFVSGVAALIIAGNPAITGPQIESRIIRGVDDLGTVGKDYLFGYGRINAIKAFGDFLSAVDAAKIFVFPNPFRLPAVTKITVMNVPIVSKLSMRIHSIAGELIRLFTDREIMVRLDPDEAYVEWDGKNNSGQAVVPGVYLFVLNDGTVSAAKKIMLLR